jgi:hypothetical protein
MVLYAWGLLTTAVLFGASAEWADIGRFALGLSSAAVIACFWRDDTPAPIPRATASGWSYQRLCRLLGYSPTPLAEGRPIQVFDATDRTIHSFRNEYRKEWGLDIDVEMRFEITVINHNPGATILQYEDL